MLNPLSLAKKLFSILRSVGGKLFGTILKDILPAILKRFPMLGKLLGGLFSAGDGAAAGGLFSGLTTLGGKALDLAKGAGSKVLGEKTFLTMVEK